MQLDIKILIEKERGLGWKKKKHFQGSGWIERENWETRIRAGETRQTLANMTPPWNIKNGKTERYN